VNLYKAGATVRWINPTAGGSNYSASTTLSITGGGCSGVAATPIINGGVIVAAKITSAGSGCTSDPTVSAVDGIGSGATFALSRVPQLPRNRRITYQGIGGTINGSGGFTSIGGGSLPFTPASGYAMELLATSTAAWRWLNPGSTNGASGDLLRSNGAGSFTTALTPGTGVATMLATPSSANLAAAITDETGTGAAVFGTSPTIATPTVTGAVTFDAATTATAAAGAATCNAQKCVVTSEALTTAAQTYYTLTISNNTVATTKVVQCSADNGTNTTDNLLVGRVTPGAGSVVVKVKNDATVTALNGTIKVSCAVR
jgi:hypothetical protein